MAQLLFAKNRINVKIVYYGPPGAGKTTSLEWVEQHAPGEVGTLTAVQLDNERATRLDYFPDWQDKIRERTVCLQLFTIPGDAFEATYPHRLALQGADAIVFVADSAPDAMPRNLAAWERLGKAVASDGGSLEALPVVFQWNKRDLESPLARELLSELNAHGAPAHETTATTGAGVLEALKDVTRLGTVGLEALEG